VEGGKGEKGRGKGGKRSEALEVEYSTNMIKYKSIKVDEETHKRIKLEATTKGISIMELLRDFIEATLKEKL